MTSFLSCFIDFSTLSVSSTLTAFLLCRLLRVPFAKTQQSFDKRWKHQILFAIKNIALSSSFFYITGGYQAILHRSQTRTIYPSYQMVPYVITIEGVFYTYHRAVHTKPLFHAIHQVHHENKRVYPIDTLHVGFTDSLGNVLSLLLPVYVLPVSYAEFYTVVFFYLTATFLLHSDRLFHHHALHHRLYVKNYCFVFPFFDILCGTFSQTGSKF